MPAFACDSHMHVFDQRFPPADPNARLVQHATAADYRSVQERLGTKRTVVVTPRIYGTDNAATLDAIEQLGKAHTRGVAVIRPEVTDARLRQLHNAGIRGIRFTLYTSRNAITAFDMVEPLAHRINELGWHVQLHWTAEQIAAHEALLQRLPSRIVFDHLARLPVSQGTSHPAFAIVRRLLETGRSWLKLSGPYLNSAVGERGGYADSDAVARAWVRAASNRLVWGSDWPHITEMPTPPPTLLMREILGRWVDDESTMQRIMVDNPAELYGFDGALEPAGSNGAMPVRGERTQAGVILESAISCPHCGHRRTERMPTDACLWFYECTGCHAVLRPKPGHCCVFCSYGTVKCPPMQLGGGDCCA